MPSDRRGSTGGSGGYTRKRIGSSGSADASVADTYNKNEKSSSRSNSSISSKELKISFENLISVIENCGHAQLETDSVVEMLTSMYSWVVLDADTQIVIPREMGGSRKMMWPHGSTINSRKKPVAVDPKDHRQLKKLDEDELSSVASSVVSGGPEGDDLGTRRERDMGAGQRTYYSAQYRPYPQQYGQVHHNIGDARGPQYSASHYPVQMQMPQRIVPMGIGRSVPRESVIRPSMEPVQETPEMKPAEVSRNKKDKGLKIGVSKPRAPSHQEQVLLDDY